MSVEASEAMSEVWPRWQGHVINGVFPLGRYLGCSDHSGVFLTKSAARGLAEAVVKLVPADRALVESQLPRWKRAGGLAHPHLLRLLEWGGCQLDGMPYLYTVMEYADQTLAQLLLHRALTDDEAREMLLPTLEGLAFLHVRKLVQGQLKPANILVVGDQLKLASDRIRRVSESTISANTPTVYDPPEARHGSSSTAGDIWALGVTLFEALTRRPPSGLGELQGSHRTAGRFLAGISRHRDPLSEPQPAGSSQRGGARGLDLRTIGGVGAGRDHSACGGRAARVEDTRAGTATDCSTAGRFRSGMARAVRGTVPKAASLAYRDGRSGRDSRVGLDRSARVQNPWHPRSSSFCWRIPVTESARRRARDSGGAGASLRGVHHKGESERPDHVAIGASRGDP